MGTRQVVVTWLIGLALGVSAAGAETRTVTGRVVDEEGRPVARAEVATHWDAMGGAQMRPFHAARTDRDGRFTLKVDFWQGNAPLLALNREHTRGGTLMVDGKPSDKAVIIPLGPLVRVHGRFSCEELQGPPDWTNVYMNFMPGRLPVPRILSKVAQTPLRLAQCSSWDASFAFLLPAGHYQFHGYGSTSDYHDARLLLELKAGQPDLDLGTIDLKPTALARRYGQPAPALHVTDAKGIRKDITLADFRGKWLLLDFWGTWCGPCVSVGLPRLVELQDELSSHRDRFAILTVHHTSAKTLEELEPELERVTKTFWGGKPLPFPILLDSTGQTLKDYHVQAYPTEFLIDPEGRLVRTRGGAEDFLKEKLLGSKPEGRLERQLDRSLGFGLDEMPLDLALHYLLGGETRAAARRVPDGLKAAGVDPGEPIPLTLSAQLSVRSWLDLFLGPFGLMAEVGEDEIAVIRRRPGIAPVAPSARQREATTRLEGVLGRPLTFNFRGTTLADVVKTLAERTGEPIALDPVARRAGAIDPEAVVTGSDGGRPLGVALEALLRPLGLRPLVRDEVILLARP